MNNFEQFLKNEISRHCGWHTAHNVPRLLKRASGSKHVLPRIQMGDKQRKSVCRKFKPHTACSLSNVQNAKLAPCNNFESYFSSGNLKYLRRAKAVHGAVGNTVVRKYLQAFLPSQNPFIQVTAFPARAIPSIETQLASAIEFFLIFGVGFSVGTMLQSS